MSNKLIPPLAGQNFTLLQQVSLDFHATPRVGITMKDILAPSYWAAVANQLKPGCEVRVVPEDNSFYAKLLVLSCERHSAHMAVIQYSDLTQKSKISEADFEIRPTNGNTKHGVFRKADGQVLKGGFISEKQAQEYLGDYIRAAA